MLNGIEKQIFIIQKKGVINFDNPLKHFKNSQKRGLSLK